jgi:rhamnosyltransferase
VADPSVSVLIPTREPGPSIGGVLQAIFDQRTTRKFEVVIVDSGSPEPDLRTMRGFPVRLERIAPEQFGHGRTRNLLASLASGEILMFLSQDARPASDDWMTTLIAPLEDPAVAGAYARQLPQADADPLIRYFLETTYGPRPARRAMRSGQPIRIADMFFSNVSSAMRKDVWQRVRFRPDVVMSEDQYWAYDVLKAGYSVVYHPSAQVYHSHNYSLRSLYRRNLLSGASLRGLIADSAGGISSRAIGYVSGELAYLVRTGHIGWVPYALVYEMVKAIGFGTGFRSGGLATPAPALGQDAGSWS